MTTNHGALPLSRFTVLDLTRVRAGPTCVRQLADWGANAIKIELPESVEGNTALGGPRLGSDFQNLHRNKKSITLNLKAPEGLKLFKRLVEKADVVVENYRPDVKHRLGWITNRSAPSTRVWCTAAFPVSARTGRMTAAPASTRSPRAWAG